VIKLFNCGNGDLLHNFIGHDNWVRSLTLHPTGKFLYSVSDDKTLRIWDLNYGKEKKKLEIHEHFISTVRYNPKYKIIATAGMDLNIKIWGLK
jgi:platelet-activating factor acetylhydrolase IB subunit alpha